MTEITFLDRATNKEEKEKVYGQFFLEMMYGDGWVSRFFSLFLLPIVARVAFLSRLYGLFQKSTMSKFKVKPFVRAYKIDASEFAEDLDSFHSFNDFFIR